MHDGPTPNEQSRPPRVLALQQVAGELNTKLDDYITGAYARTSADIAGDGVDLTSSPPTPEYAASRQPGAATRALSPYEAVGYLLLIQAALGVFVRAEAEPDRTAGEDQGGEHAGLPTRPARRTGHREGDRDQQVRQASGPSTHPQAWNRPILLSSVRDRRTARRLSDSSLDHVFLGWVSFREVLEQAPAVGGQRRGEAGRFGSTGRRTCCR